MIVPARDESKECPVAEPWRNTIRSIVRALAEGDLLRTRGMSGVRPISEETWRYVSECIENYGETLTELPDDAWKSSVSQWMIDRWEVLVDLWTREAGRSDLVMHLSVFEVGGEFEYEVESVHVP